MTSQGTGAGHAGLLVRPMRPDDAEVAEFISSAGALELERRPAPRGWTEPVPRSSERGVAWRARTAHLLATDPGGCWVAEVDGELAGFAVSCTRELTWILASYAFRPGRQGQGMGRVLLESAMQHGRGCLRGLLVSPADPRATRRYRLAGFDLHPTMLLTGTVARALLPRPDRVREGTPTDFDLMDSVDRRTRGAAHGPDHAALAAAYRLLVVDRSTGSGYAYVDAAGAPALLAATNRRTATALLWDALASSTPDRPVLIDHVTAGNQWAIDVGLQAGLELGQGAFLGLRHAPEPAPYLPHGSFL